MALSAAAAAVATTTTKMVPGRFGGFFFVRSPAKAAAAAAAAAAADGASAAPFVSFLLRGNTTTRSLGALPPVLPILSERRQQQQQVRFRWTKAKKKRYARHERRRQLEEEGKSLPKPPYYFPRDTPVANVRSKEDVEAESRKFDERAASEMREKLQKQEPVLRHHMNSDLKMSDRVRKLFDLHNGNQSEVVKAQKQQGMELFRLRPGDTGSSAVQVVALTTRIQQVQTHMQRHKKDKVC